MPPCSELSHDVDAALDESSSPQELLCDADMAKASAGECGRVRVSVGECRYTLLSHNGERT